MKKKLLLSLLSALIFSGYCFAQNVTQAFRFNEFPLTHNMHITWDGKYYYTCNGGKALKGQISKYDNNGRLVENYNIELDMRSIMYSPAEKALFVYCYDKSICKLIDLSSGTYQVIAQDFGSDVQATPALGPKGKTLYYFSDGILKTYSFPDLSIKQTLVGFECGDGVSAGNAAVAVSKKHIFTWDSEHKTIYMYNMKGQKVKTFSIPEGDYGFSLSFANKLIFTATDGNYSEGTWHGYAVE